MGVLEPLTILSDGRIISGHRRYRAALALNLKCVPCIIQEFASEIDEQAAIVEHNRYRTKTLQQLANEGKVLEAVYAERTKQRQATSGPRLYGGEPLVEKLPQGVGKTRDVVAHKIGLGSGRQWDKLS